MPATSHNTKEHYQIGLYDTETVEPGANHFQDGFPTSSSPVRP